MKVEVETLSPTRKKLRIELPREKLNEKLETVYRELKREVSVPGFRKGKVPRDILFLRFESHIKNTVISDILSSELENIFKERGIIPLSQPEMKTKLSDLPLRGDQPWVVEVEVEVKPDIQLPPYDQIRIKRWRPDVPREEVDRYIESLREGRAEYIPIEEERPARKGDFVKVDLKVSVPEKGIFEAEEKDLIFQIGQDHLPKEVEEKVIGMNPGETRKVEATFPQDHPEPELAGQNASFEITLKEILDRKLPDLDDEFAKEMNFESLEQMRSTIWNRMVEEAKAQITAQLYNEVTRQIVEKTDLTVPESVIEKRLSEIIREIRTGRVGTADDREKLRNPDQAEDYINQLRQQLIFEIKKAWIFEEIARRENLTVSDEEAEQVLRLEALRRNIDPERYISQIKDANRFEGVKDNILTNKVCDFLIKNATEESYAIV